MKTIFAAACALAIALFGASAVTPAWAEGARPMVSPQPAEAWRGGPSQDGGGFPGHLPGGWQSNGQGHRGVFVPQGPRVTPGYFVWNGYGWMWVPAYYWTR